MEEESAIEQTNESTSVIQNNVETTQREVPILNNNAEMEIEDNVTDLDNISIEQQQLGIRSGPSTSDGDNSHFTPVNGSASPAGSIVVDNVPVATAEPLVHTSLNQSSVWFTSVNSVVPPSANLAIVPPMISSRFPHVCSMSPSVASTRRPCILSRPPAPQNTGVIHRMQLFQDPTDVSMSGLSSESINGSSQGLNIISTVINDDRDTPRHDSTEPIDLRMNPYDYEGIDESLDYSFSSPLDLSLANNTTNPDMHTTEDALLQFPFTSPPVMGLQTPAQTVPNQSLAATSQVSTTTAVPCSVFENCSQQLSSGPLQIRQFLPDITNNPSVSMNYNLEHQQSQNTTNVSSTQLVYGFQNANVTASIQNSFAVNSAQCTPTPANLLSNQPLMQCQVIHHRSPDEMAIFRRNVTLQNAAPSQTSNTTSPSMSSQSNRNPTFTSASNVHPRTTFAPSDFQEPANPFFSSDNIDDLPFVGTIGPLVFSPNVMPPSFSSLKNRECVELQNKINKLMTEKNNLSEELQETKNKVVNQKTKLKVLQKDINKLETDKNHLSHKVDKQRIKLNKAVVLQDISFKLMLKCSQLEEENKCLKVEKKQLARDIDTLFEFYSKKTARKENIISQGCSSNSGNQRSVDILNIEDQINEDDVVDNDEDDDENTTDDNDDDCIINNIDETEDDSDDSSEDEDDNDEDDTSSSDDDDDDDGENDEPGPDGNVQDNAGQDPESGERPVPESDSRERDNQEHHQNNGCFRVMHHNSSMQNSNVNNVPVMVDNTPFQPYPNLLQNNIIVFNTRPLPY